MIVPHDCTERQIRAAFPEGADHIIAFQTWLKLVERTPNPKAPGGFRLTMPIDPGVRKACLDYAYGRILGPEFLTELRRLKNSTQQEATDRTPQ